MAREDWQSRTIHHGYTMGNSTALACRLPHDATLPRRVEAWTREVRTREALRQQAAVCVVASYVPGDRAAPQRGAFIYPSPRRSL
jgi:hypothetical protein